MEIFTRIDLREILTLCSRLYSYVDVSVRVAKHSINKNRKVELIENLQHEVSKQVNILLPNTRVKRGLINVLGTAIKFITGNLDAEDAQRYDSIIEQLIKGQENVNSNFVLLNETTTKINANFKIVEENINYLLAVNTEINLDNTLDTLIETLLFTSNKLRDLIEILNFAKRNVLHSLLIEPQNLLQILQQFHLDVKHKFPFELMIENIFVIESLVEVKVYQNKNIYNFIIEVPIVETMEYQLYSLYPIFTTTNNVTYTVSVSHPYVAISETNYLGMTEICKEIILGNYLCKQKFKYNLNDQCEYELIVKSSLNNCKIIETMYKPFVFLEFSELFVLIVNEKDTLIEKCNNVIKHHLLEGTYVINKLNNCQYQIKEIIIQNYVQTVNDYKTDFILNLSSNVLMKNKTIQLETIELEIDRAQVLQFQTSTYVHNGILYFLIIIFVTIIILYFYKMCKRNKANLESKELQEKSNLKEGGVMCQHI